jgi:hypothetical protein
MNAIIDYNTSLRPTWRSDATDDFYMPSKAYFDDYTKRIDETVKVKKEDIPEKHLPQSYGQSINYALKYGRGGFMNVDKKKEENYNYMKITTMKKPVSNKNTQDRFSYIYNYFQNHTSLAAPLANLAIGIFMQETSMRNILKEN